MVPANKLADLLETRHNLVKYHGYSISDVDEMTPVEIELTIMMIVAQAERDKN